ncbi:MAG: Flagellar hook-associated protein 2 [Candidatus Erwinia impunctatus]
MNGVAIERNSNTITDAPSGVTLSLLGTTTGSQTLSVSQDNTAVSKAITNWVSAYNTLQTTIASVTAFTSVDAGSGSQSSKNGALLGDSAVRTIQMQLKAELTNSNSTSTLKTLAQIGITQDPTTGQLSTDSTKLSSALTSNISDVKAMIIGDGKTTGITTTIGASLSSYVSSSGILTAATDGVNNTLKDLSDRYDKTNDRINTTIALYKTKFTQLDVLMNSLNNTSTYLKQQFSSSSSSDS